MNIKTTFVRILAAISCLLATVAVIRAVTSTTAAETQVGTPKVVKPAAPNPPVRKLPRRATYSNEQIFDGIESEDWQARSQTIADWRSNHEQLVDELIRIAKSKRDEREHCSPQELAITMLGELRCHEAIPLLLEKIDDFYARSVLGDLDAYPCFIALRNVGPSCVRPMLARVATTPENEVSDKAIELYAWLLFEFYGFDLPRGREAVAVVERYMALPYNHEPRRFANLQRLAEKVRELVEGRRTE